MPNEEIEELCAAEHRLIIKSLGIEHQIAEDPESPKYLLLSQLERVYYDIYTIRDQITVLMNSTKKPSLWKRIFKH